MGTEEKKSQKIKMNEILSSNSPISTSKTNLKSSLLFGDLDTLRQKQGLDDQELDQLLNAAETRQSSETTTQVSTNTGNPPTSRFTEATSNKNKIIIPENDDILHQWRVKNKRHMIGAQANANYNSSADLVASPVTKFWLEKNKENLLEM